MGFINAFLVFLAVAVWVKYFGYMALGYISAKKSTKRPKGAGVIGMVHLMTRQTPRNPKGADPKALDVLNETLDANRRSRKRFRTIVGSVAMGLAALSIALCLYAAWESVQGEPVLWGSVAAIAGAVVLKVTYQLAVQAQTALDLGHRLGVYGDPKVLNLDAFAGTPRYVFASLRMKKHAWIVSTAAIVLGASAALAAVITDAK